MGGIGGNCGVLLCPQEQEGGDITNQKGMIHEFQPGILATKLTGRSYEKAAIRATN